MAFWFSMETLSGPAHRPRKCGCNRRCRRFRSWRAASLSGGLPFAAGDAEDRWGSAPCRFWGCLFFMRVFCRRCCYRIKTIDLQITLYTILRGLQVFWAQNGSFFYFFIGCLIAYGSGAAEACALFAQGFQLRDTLFIVTQQVARAAQTDRRCGLKHRYGIFCFWYASVQRL